MTHTAGRTALLLRAVALASAGALASACSTASYIAPVTSFANGASAAQSALIEIDKQESADVAGVHKQRAVQGRGLVSFKKDDQGKDECTSGAIRCRLVISEGSKESEVAPESALRNTAALMQLVNAYAKNLSDIVAADTAAAVQSNVNATLGSAQDLAKTVHDFGGKNLGSSTVPEFATPVGEAVNWIIGNYIESVKFEGLKRATTDANPIIQEFTKVVKQELAVAADVRGPRLAEAVSARLDAFDVARTESNYDALVSSAAAYDLFLVAKPGDVFDQMAQAHDDLTKRLRGDKISLADVMAAIKTFETQAQSLSQAVHDLSELSKKKESTQ